MRFLAWVVALGVAPVCSWAQTGTGEPFLDLGMKQVAEGDFESAVFSLDTAIRRLQGDSRREALLVQAYLHLGVAYVGLDHEPGARGKFREALRLAPGARPPASLSSPRVVKLFEEERLKLVAKKSTKKRKIAIAVAGGVAVTAVAVSAAGATANQTPDVSIGRLPGGVLVSGVTVGHFWANASDAEGDRLTYAWDFGDGGTDQGIEVSRVFPGPGTFPVSVRVTDQGGASNTQTVSVVSDSLEGTWWGGFEGSLTCARGGPSLTCRSLRPDFVPPEGQCSAMEAWFTFADPRRVVAGAITTRCSTGWEGENACAFGELSEDGTRIVCIGGGGPDELRRR